MKSKLYLSLLLISVCLLSAVLRGARTQVHPQGSVSGSVFDAEGKAGFQMEVRILNADAAGADPESIFVEARHYAYVEQSGRFSLGHLPPGRYILAVNADFRFPYPVTYYPGVQDVAQAAVITVEENGRVRDLDTRLGQASLTRRVVEGTVVWADGSPAAGAYVKLLVAKYPWVAPGSDIADAEGRFSLSGYEGISYLIHAWGHSTGKKEMHAEPVAVFVAGGMKQVRLVLSSPGKGLPGKKVER